MAAPVYSITLHHLAPGAVAAGLGYPDEQLAAVSLAQLRDLLESLAQVSSGLTIYEPSNPEIRIKTDREIFVVRTRYRQLCLVGWEMILRGEEHSVSFILTTVSGTAEHMKILPKSERPLVHPAVAARKAPVPEGRIPRWVKIAVIATIIVGLNATTAWMLLRPVRTPVPKYQLLPVSESRALLIKAAGEYETGPAEGDRRLVIGSDGTLRAAKYGPQREILEERTHTARGAIAEGRTALVTDQPGLLMIQDADTVVFFGATYRRHIP